MYISIKRLFLWICLQKLDSLKSHDYTKITMVTLWLIELFSNELAVLRNYKQGKSQEYTMLQESFQHFLSRSIIQVKIYLLINNFMEWMLLIRLFGTSTKTAILLIHIIYYYKKFGTFDHFGNILLILVYYTVY